MLNNLTGLRFYASLWVFLYHAIIYIPQIDCTFLQKGYMGVDLFFILSGFILAYVYYEKFFVEKVTNKSYRNFIVKRFAKIYPMHIISFAIVAIMLYVGKYFFHQNNLKLLPELIPSILLMIHSWGINDDYSWNAPSWSISSEWFAYLFIFPCFSYIFRLNKKIFLFAVIFIVSSFIVKWYITNGFSLDNPDKLTNFGLERLFPEFILGMLLGVCRLKVKVSKSIATFLFVIGIISFYVLLTGSLGLNSDVFCIIPLATIIFSLAYNTNFDFLFDNRLFIYLGNISFAFYILQLIPFFVFKKPFDLLHQAFGDGFFLTVLKVVLLVGFNLILAAFFYKYYEEPMRKFVVKKLSVK